MKGSVEIDVGQKNAKRAQTVSDVAHHVEILLVAEAFDEAQIINAAAHTSTSLYKYY